MRFAIIKTIFFKEMLDTLRDKRTLIAMIGVPIVLYPALFIMIAQVALIQLEKIEETPSRVALLTEEMDFLRERIEAFPLIELQEGEDPEAQLLEGDLDAIVVVEGAIEQPLAAGETVHLEIRFDSTAAASNKAADRLVHAMVEHGEGLLAERLDAQGLPESFAVPLLIKRVNTAPPAKKTGSLLGSILPLMMVVMLGVGAFYPAVDLTAGEKERGTFETLLSTPTSKLEIVCGKFLTVFSLSMFTGFLNLASMIATLVFQLSQMAPDGEGPLDATLFEIPPQSIGAIVLVLIPLSFFISAIMMTVSLLARSFKEAQNYVTPFFLGITLPAGVVAIPGIDLSESARLIPIANASLLFRDLMMGTVAIDTIFTVFIATSIYALLALVLASWMFQREEVILSEEKGIPLTLRRASFEPLETPTPGLSLGLFGMVMLLLFYAGSYAQARDIASGLVITQYLLIAAPVLFVLWFARINLKSALQLTRPPWISLLGVAAMMPAWAVLAAQVGIWQENLMPAPESYLTAMQRIFEEMGEAQSVPMLLFILALSPGICEELAFRGAILSGLRDKLPSWATVLVVGVLFGLFHLSIYRFFPQALSGFLLTYLALRTRSIFPAMLAHISLNGILTQVERIPEPIMETITAPNFEQDGFHVGAVAAAAIMMTAGIGIVEWQARRHARRTP